MKNEFYAGDILLFKSHGLLGKLIKTYNWIKYKDTGPTHAGVIGEVLDNGYCVVYQSLGDGFVKHVYEDWWIENEIINGNIIMRRPIKTPNNVKKYCEELLGTPYAWQDLVSICIALFTGMYIDFTRNSRTMCSESATLVSKKYSDGDIDLEKEFGKPAGFITPYDLFVSKHYQTFKVNCLE